MTLLLSSVLIAGILAHRAAQALRSQEFFRIRSDAAYADTRARMVREQLMAAGRDISDARVLKAMGTVPRQDFAPAVWSSHAYNDGPLPIGANQTMSQPFIVAFMTEQLELKPGDRVLEVGTGSGYQAAVLAELGVEVFTVEIHSGLAERARDTLEHLGYTNVHCLTGDGFHGYAAAAPYDAIIVTCANDVVPAPLIEQLKAGGRLIIPLNDGCDQNLVLIRKEQDRIISRPVLPVRFVPMTGLHTKP